MKCQNCQKSATLHITEILGEQQYEELHLCEECAQKYLYEPTASAKKLAPEKVIEPSPISDDAGELAQRECDICGIKFVDFRNTGRLGCPHDYQAFKAELSPLLESIHGSVRHVGKTPRKLPQKLKRLEELTTLRKQLHKAVIEEAYEEAARIRDRIKQLEGC